MNFLPLLDFLNFSSKDFHNLHSLRRLFAAYGAARHFVPITKTSEVALTELHSRLIDFVHKCRKKEIDAAFINYAFEVWRKNLDKVEFRGSTNQIFFEDHSTRLYEIVLSDLALFIIEGGLRLICKIDFCENCSNFYLPLKVGRSRFCSTKCRMASHRRGKKNAKIEFKNRKTNSTTVPS